MGKPWMAMLVAIAPSKNAKVGIPTKNIEVDYTFRQLFEGLIVVNCYNIHKPAGYSVPEGCFRVGTLELEPCP